MADVPQRKYVPNSESFEEKFASNWLPGPLEMRDGLNVPLLQEFEPRWFSLQYCNALNCR